jgi:hypothetical protein
MRNGTHGEYGKVGNAKPATYRPDWPIPRSNPTLTASLSPFEHQFTQSGWGSRSGMGHRRALWHDHSRVTAGRGDVKVIAMLR